MQLVFARSAMLARVAINISYGPVSVSVSVCQTSRSSIETDE